MKPLSPLSKRKKSDDTYVSVRACDGPYAGKWFRLYRGGKCQPTDHFDSELVLDRHGTMVVYDLIETPDPTKWILTERVNNG